MQEKEIKNRLVDINNSIISFEKTLERRRDSVNGRFPAPFVLLNTFGAVCVLYGSEKIIDKISIFAQNPYLLIFGGAMVLIVTGAFYKKL